MPATTDLYMHFDNLFGTTKVSQINVFFRTGSELRKLDPGQAVMRMMLPNATLNKCTLIK